MTLTPEQQYEQLVKSYKEAFAGPHGQRVLEDLSGFCYESMTCFDVNPASAAFKEGSRMVILRIREMVNKKTDETRPTQTVS